MSAPVSGTDRTPPQQGRPRILAVTTWLPTSANPMSGVFVERDVRALSTVADVRVVHLVRPDLLGPDEATRIGTVPVRRVPFHPGRPWMWARARRELEAAARDADIVHTMAVSSLLPYARRRPAVPWVHTEHWSSFAGGSSLAVRAVRRLAFGLMRLPDVVVAVSPQLRTALAGGSSRSVAEIPNIVDVPAPAPRAEDPRPLTLAGVGGLIDRKGPLTALGATAELNRRGRPSRLVWAGDGVLADDMRSQAEALGVDLELLGTVPPAKIPAVLASCDVFVLPTSHETFGLATVEALASGRPVVVGTAGGAAADVRPPTGRVVPQRDPVAYADAIELVLDECAGMTADEIAEPVRDKYSAARFARSYRHIYDEVRGTSK